MSQQVNLLNPALRKPREWPAATPLAIACGVLLAVVAVAAILAMTQADTSEQAAERQAASLKLAQDRLTALTKVAAESQHYPQFAQAVRPDKSLKLLGVALRE